MKDNIYGNNYFFVDESGDTTFYNRNSEWIVGKENGASKILLMGFIRTTEPEFLRKKINELKDLVLNDEYLKSIPSMKKTKIAFHAKDDCPEVRYNVFKLLKDLPFTCNIVVARKTKHVFDKFSGDTQKLYDSLITSLFKNVLHLSNNNYIYIATRGSRKRQEPLEQAIQVSLKYTENRLNTKIDLTHQKVIPQTPSGEVCLQIIDYCNWAMQRAILHNDMRYYNFFKEKFGLIVDIYDYKTGWKNFYNKRNPFDIKKISPLRLGIKYSQHEADFRV